MLQFAAAKNLQPYYLAANVLRFAQHLLVNDRAGFEFVEIVKIDDRVLPFKRGVVKPALRQPADQRHLTAFEPEPNTAAGARFLTFVAFAARLAVAGTFADAEAFHAMPRARTGL